VSVVPGYGGPVSLMLQDNMYAGIDGEIPFSVGAVATPAWARGVVSCCGWVRWPRCCCTD